MNRRIFICFLVAAALAEPAPAAIFHRIGFISSSTTAVDSPLLVALRERLKELGYEDGKNIVIDYGFAQSADALPRIAEKMVADGVELIVAAGSEGILAAKSATTTIPIVMANSGDAVRAGFVASLNRPGGNVTGMTQISPELSASAWRFCWRYSRVCKRSASCGTRTTQTRQSPSRKLLKPLLSSA